jgi:hypothetical protein
LSVDIEEAIKGSVGSGVDDAITFPPAAGVAPSSKETSAFQAVGPLMKEHLGLLELTEHKESKIKRLVEVMSDLINSEKTKKLNRAGVNENK